MTLTSTALRVLACGVLAGCALSLASCNIIGPAYMLAHGPPKTPALHALEQQRPTVVFIDDTSNVLPRRALRQGIAAACERGLLDSGVLATVIDSRPLAAMAARDTAGEPTDIATLGRSAGAEVVIYVAIDAFTLSQDGQVLSPATSARVKVLDATRTDNARVWPEDREGHRVAVQQPQSRKDLPKGVAGVTQVQDNLAAELGATISQLFYKHEAMVSPSRTR